MKKTFFTLFLIISCVQISNSQIQVSCGGQIIFSGVNSASPFFNTNDCDSDLVISIDETNLIGSMTFDIEGTFELGLSQSLRFIGNQNHSISIKPLNGNESEDKFIAYNTSAPPIRDRSKVTTTQRDSKTGNGKKLEKIKIYPNPAFIDLSIQTRNFILRYSVINPQGNILLQEYSPESNTIDISNLSNGIYFIQIQTLEQVVVKEFIKN